MCVFSETQSASPALNRRAFIIAFIALATAAEPVVQAIHEASSSRSILLADPNSSFVSDAIRPESVNVERSEKY